MGQYEEAQGQHPEAENWQKAQNAAENEQCSGRHACDARARHRHAQRAENQLAIPVIDPEMRFSGLFRPIFPASHPQEMGANTTNTS